MTSRDDQGRTVRLPWSPWRLRRHLAQTRRELAHSQSRNQLLRDAVTGLEGQVDDLLDWGGDLLTRHPDNPPATRTGRATRTNSSDIHAAAVRHAIAAAARTPDVLIADHDGHVVVDWPHGRGPVLVDPALVESWAATVNDLRTQLADTHAAQSASGEVIR
jgi:hypothetical protein